MFSTDIKEGTITGKIKDKLSDTGKENDGILS